MYTYNKVTGFKDLYVLEPKKFYDERGYFFECFNALEFLDNTGIKFEVFQQNESYSQGQVVRGLHWQTAPFSQAKIVRCTEGRLIDIAFDTRENSPTRGKAFAVYLDEFNGKQLYIPEGMCHGFITIGDRDAITKITYLVNNPYNKESDGGFCLTPYILKQALNTVPETCDFPSYFKEKMIKDFEEGKYMFSEKDENLPLFK